MCKMFSLIVYIRYSYIQVAVAGLANCFLLHTASCNFREAFGYCCCVIIRKFYECSAGKVSCSGS